MSQPSTEWREKIDPGEEARFARQGELLAGIHAAKSRQYGVGRLLHRKAVLAARGTLDVLSNLPPCASHGLFAKARQYPVVVRLSNGGLEVQSNKKPDIRGFAIKVEGVSGPSSLGGTTDHQDFLLINHESFAAPDSDAFVSVLPALAKGQGALLLHVLRVHGLRGGLARLKTLASVVGKPFSGFATERFNSAVPIAVGPYAGKVRLAPVNPAPPTRKDFAQDMRDRLAVRPLTYDMSVQFFVDEATTPIEDPTKVWPEDKAPYVTVARLVLFEVLDSAEKMHFDPWGGLADHRPLGEIMRARKAAYYVSQKGRSGA